MPFTTVQLSAQRALQKAVEDHASAFRPEGSTGEVLTDWALVGCLVSYGDDGQQTAYHAAYSNGEVPEHVAVGLFEIGRAVAEGVWGEDGDED